MSLERNPSPVAAVPGLRESARRQARGLSGGVMAFLGGALALIVVVALFVLDYGLAQAPHRLVKIVIGLGVVGTIAIWPRMAMFLLPLAIPFLPWLPKVPLVNAITVLLYGAFLAWMFSRALARQTILRAGQVGPAIVIFIVVLALGLVRAIAFPVVAEFDVAIARSALIRATMPLTVFFMGMSMLRGSRDRRWMVAVLALALAAEGAATILSGPNARGGVRYAGSFGQPNELGAFLAMSVSFAAAMFLGARSWLARLGFMAAVGLGIAAIFLSLSRGAIAAVTIGLLFVALRSSRWMAALMLITLATSPLWVPTSVKDRIAESQVEVDGSDEVELTRSGRSRMGAWKVTLDTAQDHLLDGVGYASLHLVLRQAEASGDYDVVAGSAHNTYLRMLAEMGIFGLAAFLWLLWQCIRISWQGTRLADNRFDRQLAVGFGAATLALITTCGFGDRFHEIMTMGCYWVLAALVQDMVLERRARTP